jgi:hypothetical protein
MPVGHSRVLQMLTVQLDYSVTRRAGTARFFCFRRIGFKGALGERNELKRSPKEALQRGELAGKN